MSTYLIQNARAIVPVEKDSNDPKILKNREILVEDSKITSIEEKISKPRGTEKIDATGKVVLPGLINCHTHIAMNLLKGYADDMELGTWLNDWIWPFENKMTPDDIEFGALLGCLEAIASGTTTINTMYHHSDREAKAALKSGLRAVIGHVCFSWRKEADLAETKRIINKYHLSHDGKIRCSIDPHAPYTVDPDFFNQLLDLRNAYQEKFRQSPFIHVHLAETENESQQTKQFLKNQGFETELENFTTLTHYLHSMGMLKDACIAHGVYISKEDYAYLKENNTRVASCPISNLKLASGIAPINSFLSEGITVGLGTDGSSSNNVLDMFETMKITSLLHKVHGKKSSEAIPAYQALSLATKESAKTISWESIGSLEVGMKADMILVDFRQPHLIPTWNEISHLVYATKGTDVTDVFVDGEQVYKNRQFTKINFAKVLEKAEKYLQKFK